MRLFEDHITGIDHVENASMGHERSFPHFDMNCSTYFYSTGSRRSCRWPTTPAIKIPVPLTRGMAVVHVATWNPRAKQHRRCF
jgi:hypothetical protein